jgi:hypothetical protein
MAHITIMAHISTKSDLGRIEHSARELGPKAWSLNLKDEGVEDVRMWRSHKGQDPQDRDEDSR